MEIPKEIQNKIENYAQADMVERHAPVMFLDRLHYLTKGAQIALESTWVDCKERLPDVMQTVLVYDEEEYGLIMGRIDKDGAWEGGYGEELNPTHWHILPKPPQT